jgi:hypothetical protein
VTVITSRLAKLHMLPCVVCHILGLNQSSPTEAHHCKRLPGGLRIGMGHKRCSDDFTLPLCWTHHWNGVHNPHSLREFEHVAGKTEPDLWSITNEMLEEL